ncbi:MAG TPA: ATP-binding protein [Gemmatimonadaceae bacterium]|nr:ATP-binding protein [Gemmatimonadaceae bacterium]
MTANDDSSALAPPTERSDAGATGGDSPAPETREREAAIRRAIERERERDAGGDTGRGPHTGHARAGTAARAFAALAENVRDYAIFLMDPHGVITFWGEGARLIKWWSKDQAEGAHLRLLYPDGGSEDGTAEAHLRQAAEQGEYTGEGQRVRSDGSTFWAGITLTALWDDDGTLLGFAKVTRDLTARRAADALLQAAAEAAETARRAAEEASTAKSNFLATMSHEIRTPLNAILGYHELLDLEIDGPLTPGQRRHLTRAGASSRHLLTLISEVLDFSRLDAGRVAVAPLVFRIGDAVASAMGLVGPQALARGIQVTDAVSGFASGLAAWGDEHHARQILVNLLANAIKFTEPRQGEPGRVTVSAGTATSGSPTAALSGDGPWIYVRVEDTGVGIPPERLDAMFEPFVQADMSLTRPTGGTGLGLAISRRLARLMGGDVTARSEVGVGSSFFLWLPAAPVESLHTGGLEGHVTGDEAGQNADLVAPPSGVPPDNILRAVGAAVLAEMERVIHAYVARLRSDPQTPSARAVEEAEIEDHLASFLGDLASTLASIDVAAGDASAALRDATAIQRVVSTRHGAQRARLGWTEAEVRREFVILGEEITSAVRRAAPGRLGGPNTEAQREEAERALEVLAHFLGVAERVSLESYRSALSRGAESR